MTHCEKDKPSEVMCDDMCGRGEWQSGKCNNTTGRCVCYKCDLYHFQPGYGYSYNLNNCKKACGNFCGALLEHSQPVIQPVFFGISSNDSKTYFDCTCLPV